MEDSRDEPFSSSLVISVYGIDASGKILSSNEELLRLKILLMEEVVLLTKSYQWQKDGIFFTSEEINLHNGMVIRYFRAEMDVSDCVNDEWVVAYVMQEISKKYSNVAIHLSDCDGDFLLIEAAQHLPDWMDPTLMQNRFFLFQGHFHMIPHPYHSSYSSIPSSISIQESLYLLCSIPTQVSSNIENAISKRIIKAKNEMETNSHLFSCWLPRTWSSLISSYPSILCTFARLFVESTDLENSKAIEAIHTLPTVDDTMTYYSANLPKLLFSQLISTNTDEAKQTVSLIDSYLKATSIEKAKRIGFRLRLGSLLWRGGEVESSYVENEMKNETESMNTEEMGQIGQMGQLSEEMMSSLIRNESYRQYLKKEWEKIPQLLHLHSETPVVMMIQEDLKWLEVSESQIDSILRDEEGNLREADYDILTNEDLTGDKLETQMLDSFKAFVENVSNVEGIDSVTMERESEGEGEGERGIHERMNVDFDLVFELLEGYDMIDKERDDEDDNQEDEDEDEMKSIFTATEKEVIENSNDYMFDDEDLDMKVLKSLLQSYSMQEGEEGPVGTIMTSLGKKYPRR